jgi:uncharacterized C2H2 Zn-finger protein
MEDYVKCESCDEIVNCNKDNIHIVYLGDDEMTLCTCCFEDLEDELKENGWKCDDWDEEEYGCSNCGHIFEDLDDYAGNCDEISCIYCRNTKLT